MKDAKRAGTIAMLITGIVFLCAGGGVGALGALYILSAHDQGTGDPGRQLALGIGMVVVGLFIWLLAALGAFLAWRRLQPKPEQKVTIHQEVELTGDVDLASLSCEKCNAKLDKDAIKVQAGAIVVSCPYCGSMYQMVEEPKW